MAGGGRTNLQQRAHGSAGANLGHLVQQAAVKGRLLDGRAHRFHLGERDFLQHRPRQRISEAVGTWPEKRASYALLDDGSRFLRTVAFRNSVFSDFDIDIQAFHRWEEKLGAEAKKRAMRRRENGGKDPDEDYGEEGGGSKTRTTRSKRGQKK